MKKTIACFILGVLVAGCNTTNAFVHLKPDYADLPTDDLRALAGTIEAIISKGGESFDLESAGGITVDLPDIRQAIRTRAIRSPLLTEFRDSGFAIEESNGLLAVKRNSAYKKATTSRQRDRDALLVMSENENRWTIYEGLLKANNWPPRNLSAIQHIFFEARVPLMNPGQLHDDIGAP